MTCVRPPTRNRPQYLHVMAKPTGAICNLACKYCFFLSKERLYPKSDFRMQEDLLDLYIQQLLEAYTAPEVTLAWQGGEPTLMGIEFFRLAVALADKYKKPTQRIQHTIQTNGTRIDSEFCSFLKDHHFLVGLSIDGPQPMHDAYRVDKAGRGTFNSVMRAWELLQKHGVDVNILCTINAANVDFPLEVYHFFRDDLKAQFIQFIPIVERITTSLLPAAEIGEDAHEDTSRPLYTQHGEFVSERSVRPDKYGQFLIAIFDEWVRRDVGNVFVLMFDSTLGAHIGKYSCCVFAPTCGDALALEHNGDLYACDHYVEPRWKLGNVRETHLVDMVMSEQQRNFGSCKQSSLPPYCLQCKVRFACNGGCPKDRFKATPSGEPGLNYLCAGYKTFFEHVDRPMKTMAELLKRDRAPAEIMTMDEISRSMLIAGEMTHL